MAVTIIKENSINIDSITKLNWQIFYPYFKEKTYTKEIYEKKLKDKTVLCYLVRDNQELVGNSLGWFESESFYLWIIGILPKFRQKGLFSKLLVLIEDECRTREINRIYFKTYKICKEMISASLSHGFKIYNAENENIDEVYIEKLILGHLSLAIFLL